MGGCILRYIGHTVRVPRRLERCKFICLAAGLKAESANQLHGGRLAQHGGLKAPACQHGRRGGILLIDGHHQFRGFGRHLGDGVYHTAVIFSFVGGTNQIQPTA